MWLLASQGLRASIYLCCTYNMSPTNW
uniref:Uncharacterized protein n=1 Tax=Arundo donax TaxID=35708 RepID=A0A0A9CBS6_ARUDO